MFAAKAYAYLFATSIIAFSLIIFSHRYLLSDKQEVNLLQNEKRQTSFLPMYPGMATLKSHFDKSRIISCNLNSRFSNKSFPSSKCIDENRTNKNLPNALFGIRPTLAPYLSVNDYIDNHGNVYSRGDLLWNVEQRLVSDYSKIIVARLITTDIFPLVHPHRSRINLNFILQNELTPTNTMMKVFDKAQVVIEKNQSTRIFRHSQNQKMTIKHLWSPFHILNTTEYKLTMDVLQQLDDDDSNLIYSSPLDLSSGTPMLSLSNNYIATLLDSIISHQTLYREAVSLGARWTLLLNSNTFLTLEGWGLILSAIQQADELDNEFVLLPTVKDVSSYDKEGLNGYSSPKKRLNDIKSTSILRDLAPDLIRLPPQLIVRYDAMPEVFGSGVGIWGAAGWAGVIHRLSADPLFNNKVYCLAAVRHPLHNNITNEKGMSGQNKEDLGQSNLEQTEYKHNDTVDLQPGLNSIDVEIIEKCGYVVELSSYPFYGLDENDENKKTEGWEPNEDTNFTTKGQRKEEKQMEGGGGEEGWLENQYQSEVVKVIFDNQELSDSIITGNSTLRESLMAVGMEILQRSIEVMFNSKEKIIE